MFADFPVDLQSAFAEHCVWNITGAWNVREVVVFTAVVLSAVEVAADVACNGVVVNCAAVVGATGAPVVVVGFNSTTIRKQ
ncbi:hypothetical protein DPMN_151804 [Dreissena polymorpha]|uniref:Uncharacterized protein n=1 Tax=Dreissena polymorpha TaxID=45954 RepID=A0A9D4FKP9_DREPO|nr:hypothetical protein DPMN_151804 [Dreissena polymorpha]